MFRYIWGVPREKWNAYDLESRAVNISNYELLSLETLSPCPPELKLTRYNFNFQIFNHRKQHFRNFLCLLIKRCKKIRGQHTVIL